MRPVEWFVRAVRPGETHHGRADYRAESVVVSPMCGRSRFVALNRSPIHECYYDDQRCPDCLRLLASPALTLVRAS
ncbi:hypothetical protein [Actinoalloteichus hymeniacidonis]|uniref:Uncharacterized protein n=1 Tax=Actinoalloteichus hymeniacidonis TaxID=340345 RepID=A0AAC9MXM3_9PSEU|nr:hypothetical protein [Actinoalloteichus hymeniacidonis]AOS62057.1 hypothetical protein TL08_06160 [Actinoalloteichus hymeniacidonis]MBB5909921.1 hypothetical protein [Actinoalloteichus hymeniacidonis]